MKQKINRTKKYAAIGACISALWMGLLVMLLNHETISQLPIIVKLEPVLNVLLLILLVCFVRCLILLFQTRTLLAAGEAGLYLQVSRKNCGIVPWGTSPGLLVHLIGDRSEYSCRGYGIYRTAAMRGLTFRSMRGASG